MTRNIFPVANENNFMHIYSKDKHIYKMQSKANNKLKILQLSII